jgi:hypothetical protein
VNHSPLFKTLVVLITSLFFVYWQPKKPNPKEMNPYLRNDGMGYPDESTPSREASQLLASSVVGDGGASWRLKALKRAKEQAAREGRNIEEVCTSPDMLISLATFVSFSSNF